MLLSEISPEKCASAFLGLGVIGDDPKPALSLATKSLELRGEDRIPVSSPKVATYDLRPEMSALELTDKVVDAIGSAKYNLIVLNYANPRYGRPIADAIRKVGGVLLVTADHGNCEMMWIPTLTVHVPHDKYGA